MILLHLISKCYKEITFRRYLCFYCSAYHGHLSSLVELSTYEFKKYKNNSKPPEHVHIVSCKST